MAKVDFLVLNGTGRFPDVILVELSSMETQALAPSRHKSLWDPRFHRLNVDLWIITPFSLK